MDTERTPEPGPGEPEHEDTDFARGQHELDEWPGEPDDRDG